MRTKKCTGECGRVLPLMEFSKQQRGKYGVRAICNECGNKLQKERYKENREEILRKAREYRNKPENKKKAMVKRHKPENKKKRCEESKEYHKNNKQKINKKRRNCYLENREEILVKVKEYQDKPENKKKKAKYAKEYRKKNKEKIAEKSKIKRGITENKEKINKAMRDKRKTDVNFKILCNLRGRINKALNGNNKSLSTVFLIGCEIDYLMYHLQEKFTKGMSWDNYGLWHVDHIKPCSKFDMSKKSEQLKCFNFTNLQPLWAIDNLKKGINDPIYKSAIR